MIVFVVFVRATGAEPVAFTGDGIANVLVEFEQTVENFEAVRVGPRDGVEIADRRMVEAMRPGRTAAPAEVKADQDRQAPRLPGFEVDPFARVGNRVRLRASGTYERYRQGCDDCETSGGRTDRPLRLDRVGNLYGSPLRAMLTVAGVSRSPPPAAGHARRGTAGEDDPACPAMPCPELMKEILGKQLGP